MEREARCTSAISIATLLGANGIVGGGIPIAVGAGFANHYRGDGRVSVSFFGDGATNIGAFHEAANLAAALALPVVFVCENNEYGEYSRRDDTMAIDDVADRAAAYGMPSKIVDGMDAFAVYDATTVAVDRARRGDGPTFLECKTYRYYNHHGVQVMGSKYRTDEEVEQWRSRDAIDAVAAWMLDSGVIDNTGLDQIRLDIVADLDRAIAFADDSPFPDPAELTTDVYSVLVAG